MLGLYFGSLAHIISTVLIVGSICFSIYIVKNGKVHKHWGRTFFILFVIGLLMSIFSGTRDAIGTPGGFPTNGALFVILCALGILGFIIGLIALLSKLGKTNTVFRYGSYILIVIIIIKTVLVESIRIISVLS